MVNIGLMPGQTIDKLHERGVQMARKGLASERIINRFHERGVQMIRTGLMPGQTIDKFYERGVQMDKRGLTSGQIIDRFHEKGVQMGKKGLTPEQIIDKLHEAVALNRGVSNPIINKKIGVRDHTYYRLRKEHGDMIVDKVRQLKELERENYRLKKLVADLALDNELLRET